MRRNIPPRGRRQGPRNDGPGRVIRRGGRSRADGAPHHTTVSVSASARAYYGADRARANGGKGPCARRYPQPCCAPSHHLRGANFPCQSQPAPHPRRGRVTFHQRTKAWEKTPTDARAALMRRYLFPTLAQCTARRTGKAIIKKKGRVRRTTRARACSL